MTETKIDTVYNLLSKNQWVAGSVLSSAIGTDDLRPVRHLREYGYNIVVRKNKDGSYSYKRTND